MHRIQVSKLVASALLFAMANLKAAPPEPLPMIAFPPSTAEKWILPNGLTIIVHEDYSVPVASVHATCSTGSIDEDQHVGEELSHFLDHILCIGTKTQSAKQSPSS